MNTLDFLLEEGLILALIGSLGGCLIRQSTEYKAGHIIKWQVMVIDWFTALFLGFYTFWFIFEDVNPSLINACIINIIVGYLGSKVIELAKMIVIKKTKIYFSLKGKDDE